MKTQRSVEYSANGRLKQAATIASRLAQKVTSRTVDEIQKGELQLMRDDVRELAQCVAEISVYWNVLNTN